MKAIVKQKDNQIIDELHWIDNVGYVSIRGLARLCGVSHQAILKLIKSGNQTTLKNIKIQTQSGLRSGNLILDIDATDIIQHYAFKGKKTAQDSLKAFSAMGLRTWIKKELGVQESRELSPDEIVQQALVIVNERVKALEEENQQLKPAAENYERFIDEGTNIKVGEFAKLLKIKNLGQNNLFELLRQLGYLFRNGGNNEPYQQYINQGLFVVKEKNVGLGPSRKTVTVPLITPKGQQVLTQKIRAYYGI